MSLNSTLAAAVELLRKLPRGREDKDVARAYVESFRVAHPGVGVDLLIEKLPASPDVDYDLLLRGSEGETVALSWRADDGVPWTANYAEHWAANCVASVGNQHIEVQDALLFLKLSSHHAPSLMDELLDQLLISEALEKDPPPVEDWEVQEEVRRFRIGRRLGSKEKMQNWLDEHGLSSKTFQNMMSAGVRARKFKWRVAEEQIAPYFTSHQVEFDIVQFFQAEAPTEALALELATMAREEGLLTATQRHLASADGWGLEGSLISQCAYSLPPMLASAEVGTIVGPNLHGIRYRLVHLLQRRPSELDSQTREVVREKLFREWLTERRQQMDCRWHWM
jgi:putative peptide maturation system protein